MSLERKPLNLETSGESSGNILPYEGAALSHVLIERLNAAKHPPELQTVKEKFETIYRKLPEAAAQITRIYHDTLTHHKLNPGQIRLYMVGGRIQGKPLREDSDIDLMIAAQYPNQTPEALMLDRFEDPMDAMDFRIGLKQKILKDINEMCKSESFQIPNEFHVLSFGAKIPEDKENTENSLLIGYHR